MDVQALIKKHEGCRLKPYLDTEDKWTIGFGRNLSDNGISQYEAELMLVSDIEDVYRDLSCFKWISDLNPAREAVIVDMVYNLGINRFKGFKKTIAHIAVGDYYLASIEMLDSKWARQVGHRAIELSHMMKTGEWQ